MKIGKNRVSAPGEIEVDGLTEKIIGAAFVVSNTLGAGFLEKVYENAMVIECQNAGLKIDQQKPIRVFYRDEPVGEYIADLFVGNQVVVELKSVKNLEEIHLAQILNYLKGSNLRFGLLLNFGQPRVEVKRVINGY